MINVKKITLLILTLLLIIPNVFSSENTYTTENLKTYSLNNKYFGLKNSATDEIIVEAKYKKLIRVGNSGWIIQTKRNKFGLIDCNGNIIIEPTFTHVERVFNKYVKLGNETNYGLYDEYGKIIIPPEFSSIEPLYGHKYLTCKKHKYGIYSADGRKLLDNEYNYIYSPDPKTIRINYLGNWYEIESITDEEGLSLADKSIKVKMDDDTFIIKKVLVNTGVGTGYSVVTAADYMLKILSTISTAYENTIDDLMFSQGAETVSIFIKLSWIPKFPFIYAKKYYNNLFTPNTSPLSEIRNEIINQIK